jgi:L-fuconolactonase
MWPSSTDLFSAVCEAGKSIDLDVSADEIASALALLESHPTARIVLVPQSSGAWNPAPWREFSRLPQVAIKVCGLINHAGPAGWHAETYRPFVQAVLEWFGPDRLIYGSDWPHCMHTGTWKESLAAFTQALGAQTIDVRSCILGGNGERIYLARQS